MQAERDYLVKFVFPQLRKLCDERAVTWTEVDLRWGITDEQTAEGQVLPLCLEEIQRCRPYFIGLLGERYGWIPEDEEVPHDLLEAHPWLEERHGRSVTELEILHGVLRDPAMADFSLFYFRDPSSLDRLADGEDPADFASESPDAAEKLADLKSAIRNAHTRGKLKYAPRENYADPVGLGALVLDDLTGIIDALFPQSQVPDPLDQEAVRHEAYAQSRRLGFVGREDLLCRLDELLATDGEPLVLTGESGCGKSALLGEWVARWRKEYPEDLIIQHYIGSTPDSADWQSLVRRVLGELKRTFAIADDIPVEPDALRSTLSDWTVKAAGPRRIVLVIDALNQLADDGAARQLGWLPIVFPTNFRVLVSALPGESLDVLRERGWPELGVPLFARADIAPAALAYFRIFSKTPPSNIVAKLEATPAACNALYLRAVLDELRQFGKHEELEAKAAEYLSAPDLPALFDRILTRWHDDFGQCPDHPDLVRRSLCLIACARFGLAESEIIDLLGDNERPLPRRVWTPIYLAAENALVHRAGLLGFGHAHLRIAVWERWLEDKGTIDALREQLAEYFSAIPGPSDRKLDELPTLLHELRQWGKLKEQLADVPNFLRLTQTERWKLEMHRHWLAIGDRSCMAKAYSESLEGWARAHPGDATIVALLNNVGLYMSGIAGYHDSAEPFIRKALELWDNAEGIEKDEYAPALTSLGTICSAQGRTEEAEGLFRRALSVYEGLYRHDDPVLVAPLCNLAHALTARGDLATAEVLQLRALAILRDSGVNDIALGTVLHNAADRMELTGDLADAKQLAQEALLVRQRSLGSRHPDVAQTLSLLGILARRRGDLGEAGRLFLQALRTDEEAYGDLHPKVAIRLNNLALLLKAREDFSAAEELLQRAVLIGKTAFTSPNPDLAIWLNNLAGVLVACGRQREAVPLLREALEILDTVVGAHDDKTCMVCQGLTDVLFSLGRGGEALPFLERAVQLYIKQLGLLHVSTFTGMANLGVLYLEGGRLEEGMEFLTRSFKAHIEVLGRDHPQTIALGGFLNHLVEARGE